MRIPIPSLSVRTLRKENHPGFVNISPTLVIDASMEGLHEYYTMEAQKFELFQKSSKSNFGLC